MCNIVIIQKLICDASRKRMRTHASTPPVHEQHIDISLKHFTLFITLISEEGR